MSDYERITRAIAYLNNKVTEQPTLEQLAAYLHLSPFHCQRLFTRWAGTSPKRFLQVLTLELGKNLLDQSYSVLQASDAAGLSSSSRLYDHFVQLEGVTPGQYQTRGQNLTIEYGVSTTPFGELFLARTPKGICKASFFNDPDEYAAALVALELQWPAAILQQNNAAISALAKQIFTDPRKQTAAFTVHVQGTNFQLAVWRALLSIPNGKAVSYAQIASAIGRPNSARAAGNAIGANPVAVLIPCHRVIQQSGALGGYRWCTERKVALQAWERILAT